METWEMKSVSTLISTKRRKVSKGDLPPSGMSIVRDASTVFMATKCGVIEEWRAWARGLEIINGKKTCFASRLAASALNWWLMPLDTSEHFSYLIFSKGDCLTLNTINMQVLLLLEFYIQLIFTVTL